VGLTDSGPVPGLEGIVRSVARTECAEANVAGTSGPAYDGG
jgi:hypothetical protein